MVRLMIEQRVVGGNSLRSIDDSSGAREYRRVRMPTNACGERRHFAAGKLAGTTTSSGSAYSASLRLMTINSTEAGMVALCTHDMAERLVHTNHTTGR